MGLLSAVTSRVQTAVRAVEQKVEQVRPQASAPSAATVRDTFSAAPKPKLDLQGGTAALSVAGVSLGSVTVGLGGLNVRAGGDSVDIDGKKGVGGSTHVLGVKVGAHLKTSDGAAVLGAVAVECAGKEVAMGLVPAAPAPLLMVVYAGKARDAQNE
jgi:hypothetical protein